jgi:hypothetical protein
MKRYEIAGGSTDAVVKAIIGLRFYYGYENVLVDSPVEFMLKKDKVVVSIDFSDRIKLQSGGDPRKNIMNEMNYVLEQEMMIGVSISDTDQDGAPKAETQMIPCQTIWQ